MIGLSISRWHFEQLQNVNTGSREDWKDHTSGASGSRRPLAHAAARAHAAALSIPVVSAGFKGAVHGLADRPDATDGRPRGLASLEVRTVVPHLVAQRLEFEEFFRAEYPGLVRAFYVLTADRSEAEELAQEAMARAYERWERVGAMESPSGYLYRVGVNLNRHRRRHLAVRARWLLAMTRDARTEQAPGVRGEIADAIASLSVGQREAFMLVEWLGLSAEEAGPVLDIAPASVRSRVHRAKATLRARLSDEGGESWTT
jgi:RNA polymerase sigma factor (sigma-70 family)